MRKERRKETEERQTGGEGWSYESDRARRKQGQRMEEEATAEEAREGYRRILKRPSEEKGAPKEEKDTRKTQ